MYHHNEGYPNPQHNSEGKDIYYNMLLYGSRSYISHTHNTSGLAGTVRSLANQARGAVFLLAWTFVSPLPKEFQGKYYYWKRRVFFLE